MKTDLTVAQMRQLRRIKDGGLLTIRLRTGGAVFRMLDRMVAAGLITKPPHKLTTAGREAMKQWSKS